LVKMSNNNISECIINKRDIWAYIFNFLESNDWINTILVSKTAYIGFKRMLLYNFGNINTWSYKCPLIIHKWKCIHGLNGPFTYNPPPIEYFKNGPLPGIIIPDPFTYKDTSYNLLDKYCNQSDEESCENYENYSDNYSDTYSDSAYSDNDNGNDKDKDKDIGNDCDKRSSIKII
jgi:hypothetical protein